MNTNTQITVTLTSEFRLAQALMGANVSAPATVAHLIVAGTLNKEDFDYIRENMAETLRELDMGNASVEPPGNDLFRHFCKNLPESSQPESAASDFMKRNRIEDQTNRIADHAFMDCIGLTSVVIPNSVAVIGRMAFKGCINLISIIIPDSVVEICDYAFKDCNGLSSVTVPAPVTKIGCGAFSGCSGLTDITVDAGNSVYTSDNGVLFNKERTELMVYPASRNGNYVIPCSVSLIGVSAFGNCTGLTAITIPDSMKKIGECAFCDCTGLTSVTIPDSVTEIDFCAFQGCSGLTSISIPASVEKIGKQMWPHYDDLCPFAGCAGLTGFIVHCDNPVYASENGVLFNKNKSELIAYPKARRGDYVIPGSVSEIGVFAFSDCTGLMSVMIPDSVKEISDYAFNGCTGLTSFTIPESVEKIDDYAFYNCSGLTSITIPASVTKIGERDYPYDYYSWSFDGCTGLTTIETHPDNPQFASIDGVLFNKKETELIEYPQGRQGDYLIPELVEKIHISAFFNCAGLTSVTIPDSVKEIEHWVFHNCTGLISVNIPASVENIEEEAFSGCCCLTDITVHPDNPFYASENGVLFNKEKTELILYPAGRQGNYIIPASVTKLRIGAFCICTGLTSVTIPSSVTKIEQAAFQYCTGLTSITLPNTTTRIGWRTFGHCTGLTSVIIPDSSVDIAREAFADCTGLKSVFIPASATKIEKGAFKNCPAFFTVHPDNPVYTSENGVLKRK